VPDEEHAVAPHELVEVSHQLQVSLHLILSLFGVQLLVADVLLLDATPQQVLAGRIDPAHHWLFFGSLLSLHGVLVGLALLLRLIAPIDALQKLREEVSLEVFAHCLQSPEDGVKVAQVLLAVFSHLARCLLDVLEDAN
jgi:hypothetical protein